MHTPDQYAEAQRIAHEVLSTETPRRFRPSYRAERVALRVPASLLPTPKKAVKEEDPKPRLMPPQERIAVCDPANPLCCFHDYVGNADAVLFAMGLLNDALSKASPCNVCLLLTGDASCGKTFFVDCFGKGIDLPVVKCLGTAIGSRPEKMAKMILTGYAREGRPLVPRKSGGRDLYKLPRAILFFDECHEVKGEAQEAMLTMCEGKDRTFILPDAEFDCSDVAIFAATNKVGEWGKAIKSRFVHLPLKRHSLDEVALILHKNLKFAPELCREMVEYERVPRKAIDFARAVQRSASLFRVSPPEAIAITAKMLGKLRGGISQIAVNALLSLADAPNGLSRSALCAAIRIEEQEFISDVVPQLMRSEHHAALITVSNRHKITDAGLAYLAEIN